MASSYDPRLLTDFARYHGFHYGVCDPTALLKDLRIEMERGLCAAPSSLAMLPSWLSAESPRPCAARVLALDAGGTNLRAAIVDIDESGAASIARQVRTAMPGTRGKLSAEAFFDHLAAELAPLLVELPTPDAVGFCFSYDMEIVRAKDGDVDGIVRSLSKELDVPELRGASLSEGLRTALSRRGTGLDCPLVALNDTAATLLAGAAGPARDTVGFILGTGMNVAYPERRIPKVGFEDEKAPQIVVCESGSFKTRYLGRIDAEFDATLLNPGAATYEKAIAGAYLGPLSLFILKRAVEDGVVHFRRERDLLALDKLETRDLNAFQKHPRPEETDFGALFADDESEAVSSILFLCSLVTRRAALFAAAAVAAAMDRAGLGYDPLRPARIAVEGSTYQLYAGMRPAFDAALANLLQSKAPRAYVLELVEQGSLLGAAKAAATCVKA